MMAFQADQTKKPRNFVRSPRKYIGNTRILFQIMIWCAVGWLMGSLCFRYWFIFVDENQLCENSFFWKPVPKAIVQYLDEEKLKKKNFESNVNATQQQGFFMPEIERGSCFINVHPVDDNLPKFMLSGEIHSENFKFETSILRLNGVVALALQNAVTYIHRPLINLHSSTSTESYDTIEAFLSLGRGEISWVSLIYSDIFANLVHVKLSDSNLEAINQIQSVMTDAMKNPPESASPKRVLFIRSLYGQPEFHKSFRYTGPWFRSKYMCSKLKSLPQTDFTLGRVNIAVLLSSPLDESSLPVVVHVGLTKQVVAAVQNIIHKPLDIHLYMEKIIVNNDTKPIQVRYQEELPDIQQKFSTELNSLCHTCRVFAHQYINNPKLSVHVIFKHLVEADIFIPSRSDFARIAAVMSRNIKVIPSGFFDLSGWIYTVRTKSIFPYWTWEMNEDVNPVSDFDLIQLQEKFKRRFSVES